MKAWFLAVSTVLMLPPVALAQDFGQGLNLPMADFDTKLPPPKPAVKMKSREEKFNHPMYNPETKSYFEYYSPANGLYDNEKLVNWEEAKALAQTRAYKGARGRLAIVKTKETNDFIIKNLQPQDGTWIGLEYICDLKTLRWVTGEFWPLTGYQNWNRPWNVEGVHATNTLRSWCSTDSSGRRHSMGIHYWGPETGYKWNANGSPKKFGWMIIEYPTGKP
jgi:hypothetical protein